MAESTVETVEQVVEVLGGNSAFRQLTKITPQILWNWKRHGIPAKQYRLITEALQRQGVKPNDSIWAVEMPSMTDRPF